MIKIVRILSQTPKVKSDVYTLISLWNINGLKKVAIVIKVIFFPWRWTSGWEMKDFWREKK